MAESKSIAGEAAAYDTRSEGGSTLAHPSHVRRASHLLRHLVEMFVAMAIGMFVGAWIFLTIAGGLTPIQGMTRYPVLFVIVMAFSMTAPMVGWMRFRGHSRRSCREMTVAMMAPAGLIIGFYWLGIIPAPLCSLYCVLSTAAMIGLMVYRRRDYGM
jgi:uncharacterized membrane protein YfcA